MKNIEYELFPEAYGANGKFISKTGSLTDLVIDTGILTGSDFDKVIPTFEVMNELFKLGTYPRAAEWDPFDVSKEEYEELVKELLALPLTKPYRLY